MATLTEQSPTTEPAPTPVQEVPGQVQKNADMAPFEADMLDLGGYAQVAARKAGPQPKHKGEKYIPKHKAEKQSRVATVRSWIGKLARRGAAAEVANQAKDDSVPNETTTTLATPASKPYENLGSKFDLSKNKVERQNRRREFDASRAQVTEVADQVDDSAPQTYHSPSTEHEKVINPVASNPPATKLQTRVPGASLVGKDFEYKTGDSTTSQETPGQMVKTMIEEELAPELPPVTAGKRRADVPVDSPQDFNRTADNPAAAPAQEANVAQLHYSDQSNQPQKLVAR